MQADHDVNGGCQTRTEAVLPNAHAVGQDHQQELVEGLGIYSTIFPHALMI